MSRNNNRRENKHNPEQKKKIVVMNRSRDPFEIITDPIKKIRMEQIQEGRMRVKAEKLELAQMAG